MNMHNVSPEEDSVFWFRGSNNYSPIVENLYQHVSSLSSTSLESGGSEDWIKCQT